MPIRRDFILLAIIQLAMGHVSAQGILGHDCRACHLTPRNAMTIQGQQSTVDFGSGPLKVFRVHPGQTAPIAINVIDGHDRYAIGIAYPFPGGTGDTNRHLTYQPDPSWRDGTTYYATSTTNVNQQWTYNLAVLSNAPPDFYLLTIQTAGITNVSPGPVDEWSHWEDIYVQVVPTNAPAPQMVSPQADGTGFSVRVATLNGLAYTLEYKRTLTETSWSTACQIPGDGNTKTLSDTNAYDPSRFYRVRVQ